MIEAAGERLPVRLEAVDSNGLLPLRATEKNYVRAYDLRRFMRRELGIATPPPSEEAPASEGEDEDDEREEAVAGRVLDERPHREQVQVDERALDVVEGFIRL